MEVYQMAGGEWQMADGVYGYSCNSNMVVLGPTIISSKSCCIKSPGILWSKVVIVIVIVIVIVVILNVMVIETKTKPKPDKTNVSSWDVTHFRIFHFLFSIIKTQNSLFVFVILKFYKNILFFTFWF